MLRMVNRTSGEVTLLPGSEGLWSPRWSPDGRYLAALTQIGWKLVLYDVSTHGRAVLSQLTCSYPTWSADGEYLYFGMPMEHSWRRIRVRDRGVELVRDLNDIPQSESLTAWFTFAPDGSLLTRRETGLSEIYALDWVTP
jgi:Tol biopolymer transport system component